MPLTYREHDEDEARDIALELAYYERLDAEYEQRELQHPDYDPDERGSWGTGSGWHVSGMDDEDRTWHRGEVA